MKRLFSKPFLPILLAALITLLFFIPSLVKGKIPLPADDLLGLYHPWRDISVDGYNPGRFPAKNSLITDPILQTYPWKLQVIEDFKQGNWPLWNPYNFSGQPLLANFQSAPLSVFNVLYFTMPFNYAWTLEIIISSILATIFLYLYLKNLKLETYAAIFGSVVLPFTGFFIAWLTWGNIVTTALWLPLILLSLDKIFAKSKALWFLVLVFSLSQTIFSGHLQTAFYVFLSSFLYLIYLSFSKKNLKIVLIAACAFILAILITSPQVLPSLEFSKISARSQDQSYFSGRQDWFIPLSQVIQLIAPDFFGNPTTNNYWGVWNYGEFVSYVGLIPLALALLAIFKRKPESRFFTLLLLLAIVLALRNPISLLPYALKVPIISTMQPSRIIFLLVFSLSVLSAIGLDHFFKEKSKFKLLVPILVLTSSLLAISLSTVFLKSLYQNVNGIDSLKVAKHNLVFPMLTLTALLILVFLRIVNFKKSLLLVAIFVLTLVELFRFGYKFTPFSKLSWVYPETKTTDFLRSQSGPYRLLSLDRRIFNGQSPSVYSIEVVHGYDPLFLEDYAHLVSSWQAQKVVKAGSFNRIVTPDNYSLSLINFLNVRYIATFDELTKPGFEKVFTEGETKIYENKNVLPRAFFTNKVTKIGNNDQILAKIVDKNFDPVKETYSQDYSLEASSTASRVNFKKYSSQSFTLETRTAAEAPLIVSNIFYPGWKAFIDGRQTVIQKVNYLFQSIVVPKGNHEVEFKYEPQSFYNGQALSLLGIILTIFAYITWRKKYL